MSKNKKKNNKNAQGEEVSFKLSGKMIDRIIAGSLAAMMVLGTVTMTIMYFMESFHMQ